MGNCPEILDAFEKCRCPQNHEHVHGRGLDLKLTEEYTYQITDLIHKSFRAAALKTQRSSQPRSSPSLVAIIDMASEQNMADAGPRRSGLAFSC